MNIINTKNSFTKPVDKNQPGHTVLLTGKHAACWTQQI